MYKLTLLFYHVFELCKPRKDGSLFGKTGERRIWSLSDSYDAIDSTIPLFYCKMADGEKSCGNVSYYYKCILHDSFCGMFVD